jgi:UDP-2,3-diacylglucosamine pyrophosphatase LpxH
MTNKAPLSSLLIVSDLHLGSALRPPMGYHHLKMITRLDMAFENFLEYHKKKQIVSDEGDIIPWTLIFNGDTIDFLHMGLSANRTSPPSNLKEDENKYGLSFVERRSRWKLQEIARYHRRAFRVLCEFLEAGNSCVFVVGNHDADLWFEKVRQDLSSLISRYSKDPKGIKRKIHFAPWFYYEEGRIYIEHGHRFDPYSTFPDPLSPVEREEGQESLQPTFAHWGLRYFSNPVPTFPIHNLEDWSAFTFIHWAFKKAGMSIFSLVAFYAYFIWRYIQDTSYARKFSKESVKRRSRKLSKFAKKSNLSYEDVKEIDALHLPHIGASWFRLAQALYIDKMFLVSMGLVAMMVAWQFFDNPFYFIISISPLIVILNWVWIYLSKIRPPQDCDPLLGEKANQIGDIAQVPLVVFGHTHHATLQKEGDVRFLNPGTWEELPRKEDDHEGDETCNCGATFAVVTGEAENLDVNLYKWCPHKKVALKITHPEHLPDDHIQPKH